MFIVAALSLGSQLLVTVADQVPRLNVEPSCRAAAQAAIMAGRDLTTCMQDERAARDQLFADWSRYPAADKLTCTQLNSTGGPQSYVELLSCLELTFDARKIGHETGKAEGSAKASKPFPDLSGTTGQGSSINRR
jgi:hypothetical protein